jgi:hypothetical protein
MRLRASSARADASGGDVARTRARGSGDRSPLIHRADAERVIGIAAQRFCDALRIRLSETSGVVKIREACRGAQQAQSRRFCRTADVDGLQLQRGATGAGAKGTRCRREETTGAGLDDHCSGRRPRGNIERRARCQLVERVLVSAGNARTRALFEEMVRTVFREVMQVELPAFPVSVSPNLAIPVIVGLPGVNVGRVSPETDSRYSPTLP